MSAHLLLSLPLFSVSTLHAAPLADTLIAYRNSIWLLGFIFVAVIVIFYLILRRQARLKREIETQKEAFKTLFNKSHDGILLIEDGKFIECNEAILRMLGYETKEALLDLHPSRLSPKYQPDGRASFEKAEEMMAIAMTQGYNQFEWVHTRANGETFWAEIVLTRIRLSDKDIIHVVWRDIDERKALEEKNRQLNQQLEARVEQRTLQLQTLLSLFDKGESILFKWNNDATWSVDYVSMSITKVLGYTQEEFLSHKVVYANCIHEEDLPHVTHELETAIKSQQEYFEHDPYRIYTRDGTVKWVHDATVIVRNTRGEITHFLGYITDITDIKEKERQFLQQAKLAQMGEMIGMIAHQWRQPLNAIAATASNLSLKLALEEPDTAYLSQEVALIEEYTQHLSKTIDDFRSFFKKNKKRERVMLRDLCTDALKIVQISLKNRNITLHTAYHDTTPLETYSSEVKQVLLNLVKNAEDILVENETENPQITIITQNDDTTHSLIIKDNGGGIPEAIAEKIFDPYFSTKLEKNGTGLGLYMSKKIIEEHCGGSLDVTNDAYGAVFTITFPIPKEPA